MNSTNSPRSKCVATAQLIDDRTGVAEATGSNPVEALIFCRPPPSNCLNWKIYFKFKFHFHLQPQYNMNFTESDNHQICVVVNFSL